MLVFVLDAILRRSFLETIGFRMGAFDLSTLERANVGLILVMTCSDEISISFLGEELTFFELGVT